MLVIKTVAFSVCLFAGLIFSDTSLSDWRTQSRTKAVIQSDYSSFTALTASFLDSTGATIYKTNCGICHNGAVAEAPRFESLKRLSSSTIIEALRNGVMKQQGAALTDEQKRLVAEYISTVGSDKNSAIAGRCVGEETIASAKPQVSNWGMGLANQRYIDDRHVQINATNAPQLTLDWVFAFPDATRARSQPTIAGNTLFTASQQGVIYALDRASGCIRWTFQADTEVRSSLVIGTDKNGNADRLYFGDFKATVYALDLKSRKLLWRKRIDEHEQATITGTLALHDGHLYVPVSSVEVVAAYKPTYPCCTFRGSVVSLNADDGALRWKTYTTDEPTQQGVNSAGAQRFGPSGAPVWSSPTIDTKRGLLYIGTGENYTRPSSATSDAILAMSMQTGAIQWVQQTVRQDSWNAGCTPPGSANCPENHGPDYDFGAPPILISRTGHSDLILAGQKSGMVYALNPDNYGAIVWQKRVGRGGIMGGIHWGMASDGQTLYVPINDHSVWPEDKDKPAFPGLHALRVTDGNATWSVIEKDQCGSVDWQCAPGLSAAITLIPGVVFAGSLDGRLHAYATNDGRALWTYDTNREFTSVNGVKATGGTIDSAGPVVVGDQLFVNSGYAKFGEKAGNVLLAFKVKPNATR